MRVGRLSTHRYDAPPPYPKLLPSFQNPPPHVNEKMPLPTYTLVYPSPSPLQYLPPRPLTTPHLPLVRPWATLNFTPIAMPANPEIPRTCKPKNTKTRCKYIATVITAMSLEACPPYKTLIPLPVKRSRRVPRQSKIPANSKTLRGEITTEPKNSIK